MEYLEQWDTSMILRWSSKSFGTTRRSLNHKTPSGSSWKHCASPNSNLLQIWPISTSVCWAAMTSSLIVGMRAILFKTPWGITWRLDSSGSQQDVRGWTVICSNDAYGSMRQPRHLPSRDDHESPIHSPWSVLTTFVASYSNLLEWTNILDSCDPCICSLGFPKDNVSRLSMHGQQPRVLDHGLDNVFHDVWAIMRQRQWHDRLAWVLL
jgi:hypothetical protein